MNRIFLSLFVGVVCTVAASSATCIIDGNKDDEDNVQVIRLDEPEDEEYSETGIIEIHIPSGSRRKRETPSKENEKSCTNDEECTPGTCDLKTSKCSSSTAENPANPGETPTEKPAKNPKSNEEEIKLFI
ncbi:uncharacterized protein LOC117181941 [Belonocnema kinseyi]|uniref:uncharacterized protein LOC117181941 n=1 Tax=Belonocnema kinseyi TaxID=2817044 RepID=UPI00143CE4FA|nr:uncharacterized protein LOC117181941 [Belonocnema kinseyi]